MVDGVGSVPESGSGWGGVSGQEDNDPGLGWGGSGGTSSPSGTNLDFSNLGWSGVDGNNENISVEDQTPLQLPSSIDPDTLDDSGSIIDEAIEGHVEVNNLVINVTGPDGSPMQMTLGEAVEMGQIKAQEQYPDVFNQEGTSDLQNYLTAMFTFQILSQEFDLSVAESELIFGEAITAKKLDQAESTVKKLATISTAMNALEALDADSELTGAEALKDTQLLADKPELAELSGDELYNKLVEVILNQHGVVLSDSTGMVQLAETVDVLRNKVQVPLELMIMMLVASSGPSGELSSDKLEALEEAGKETLAGDSGTWVDGCGVEHTNAYTAAERQENIEQLMALSMGLGASDGSVKGQDLVTAATNLVADMDVMDSIDRGACKSDAHESTKNLSSWTALGIDEATAGELKQIWNDNVNHEGANNPVFYRDSLKDKNKDLNAVQLAAVMMSVTGNSLAQDAMGAMVVLGEEGDDISMSKITQNNLGGVYMEQVMMNFSQYEDGGASLAVDHLRSI